jgi:hypothetical protein
VTKLSAPVALHLYTRLRESQHSENDSKRECVSCGDKGARAAQSGRKLFRNMEARGRIGIQ